MNPEFCIDIFKGKIKNEHLTWYGHNNCESDLRCDHLLNETLQKKSKGFGAN